LQSLHCVIFCLVRAWRCWVGYRSPWSPRNLMCDILCPGVPTDGRVHGDLPLASVSQNPYTHAGQCQSPMTRPTDITTRADHTYVTTACWWAAASLPHVYNCFTCNARPWVRVAEQGIGACPRNITMQPPHPHTRVQPERAGAHPSCLRNIQDYGITTTRAAVEAAGGGRTGKQGRACPYASRTEAERGRQGRGQPHATATTSKSRKLGIPHTRGMFAQLTLAAFPCWQASCRAQGYQKLLTAA